MRKDTDVAHFGRRGQALHQLTRVGPDSRARSEQRITVEHHGEIFDFAALEMAPAPVEVPLVIGGNSDAALRRAARAGDGWFSSGTPDFEEAVRLRDRLLALREELGKQAEPFETVVRIEGADAEDVRRYGAAGFDHVVIWADQVWPQGGSLEEKRARLTQAARELRAATQDLN